MISCLVSVTLRQGKAWGVKIETKHKKYVSKLAEKND